MRICLPGDQADFRENDAVRRGGHGDTPRHRERAGQAHSSDPAGVMIEALRAAVDEVLLALAPLTQAAGDSGKMRWLLSELGWTPDSVPQPLAGLATAGSDLIGLVGADPDATSTPEVFAAVGKLVAAIDEIRTTPDSTFPSGLDVASFKATIGPDLLDYLLVEHLLSYHYGIAGPLLLAGVIRLLPPPPRGLRAPYLRRPGLWRAPRRTFEGPVGGVPGRLRLEFNRT